MFLLRLNNIVWLIALSAFFCGGCDSDEEKTETNVQSQVTNNQETVLIDLVTQYPDSLILKENLIQFYRNKEDYQKALQSIDQYIRRDSVNPKYWEMKATLHFESDDTMKAVDAFEHKIRIQPDADNLYKLGMIYAYKGMPNALKVAENLAASNDPELQSNALLINAVFETRNGHYAEALLLFDQCLSLNYRFMQAYLEKANCQDLALQTNEAILTLKRAVSLNNRFADGYFQLGVYYEKINEKKSAIYAYAKAVLYDPEYTTATDAVNRLSH